MPTNNQLVGTTGSWTTTTNWSQGHAPTTSEFTFLTTFATAFTGNLNQVAVVLGALNQDMSFTGSLGLNGTTNTYLQISTPTTNLGLPSSGSTSSGPRTFNLDVGTSNSVINVLNTAQSGASGAPVKLLCTNATVNLTNGIISIAALASETATVNVLNVTAGSSGVSPTAFLGSGCTATTINQNNAGAVTNASQAVCGAATLSGSSASMVYIGSGGFNALSVVNGAKVSYVGNGSINSMILGGTFDTTGGGSTFHLGAGTLTAGAKLIDPGRRIIFDTPIVRLNVAFSDITFNRGIAGGATV